MATVDISDRGKGDRPGGLRGHPKPAMQGHLRSGHTERMDCGRKLGCGKAGSCAALEIAPRFPLSHNLNNNITLSVGR